MLENISTSAGPNATINDVGVLLVPTLPKAYGADEELEALLGDPVNHPFLTGLIQAVEQQLAIKEETRARLKAIQSSEPTSSFLYFPQIIMGLCIFQVSAQAPSTVSEGSDPSLRLAEIKAVLPPGAMFSIQQHAWVYIDVKSGREIKDLSVNCTDLECPPLKPRPKKVVCGTCLHPFQAFNRCIKYGFDGKLFDLHCCRDCRTYVVISGHDEYMPPVIPRDILGAYQRWRCTTTDRQTSGEDGFKQGLETLLRILDNVLFKGNITPVNLASKALISKLGSGPATINILEAYGFQHIPASDPVEKSQGHPGRYKPPNVNSDLTSRSRLLRAWVELSVVLMYTEHIGERAFELTDSRYPWLHLKMPTIHDFQVAFDSKVFPPRPCHTHPDAPLASTSITFSVRHIPENPDCPTGFFLNVKMVDHAGIEVDLPMPRAFLQRFADMTGTELSQPTAPPSFPRGLHQLDNTCYLNAILQYMYTITDLRDAIISFDSASAASDLDDLSAHRVGGRRISQRELSRSRKFVDLLQSLFINLRDTSSYAITPPLDLAKLALGDTDDDEEEEEEDEVSGSEDSGTRSSLQLGEHHDVSECLERCMFLVEAALRFSPGSENGISDRLFNGKLRHEFTFKGEEQLAQEKEEPFSRLFVTVDGEGCDLHDGLLKRFNDEVTFDGKAATMTTEIVEAPLVLMIQLQRAHFDKAAKQTYKCSARVGFDETLILDRFMGNASATKRAMSKALQGELENCHRHLAELAGPKSTSDSATIEEVIPEVEEYQTSEQQLRAAMDDLWAADASAEYELSSVFVHQGPMSNFGHYIFYTKGSSSDGDCWYKFDDESVIAVPTSEVLGAEKGTPSMLIYVRKGKGVANAPHRSTE